MSQLDREKELTEKSLKNCPMLGNILQRQRDYFINESYIDRGVKYEPPYNNVGSVPRKIEDSFPHERVNLDEELTSLKSKQKIRISFLSIKKS